MEKNKSQSQRIRNFFYRIWANGQKEIKFEQYYKARTDKIIDDLGKELNELIEPPMPEEL